MTVPENPQLWHEVAASTGLGIPPQQQESFRSLAGDVQALMATLRGTGLGETPPDFAFRVQ
ncbi:hypothetical protein AS188_08205 [Kocuria flava]|uniref:DUF4089 domain-containing protein n=1 Tax=Kocuria flava TaxID=446860 RepID=A0A0U3I8Q0_9MICC|nr:hypothetical protein [Kocuria flava]ALU39740.1 hypothetical protein AS188_08205 [Kocuria flava]GEO91762.1 hypothetical protein KFL01_10680 [Kocuria flava]